MNTLLPELPKTINKREAKITPRVLAWMKKNYPFSVALEIKVSKTNTIPASALKDHQHKALIAVKSKYGMTYKIPDTGRVQAPFDAFQLKHTTSFVVACFPKHGTCLAIAPEKWQGAKYEPMSACEFVINL